MKKFNSLEEMIEAKAQEQHEANLDRGGVFTSNPEAARAEGYEVSEESRISKIDIERKYAETKVAWCSAHYSFITIGVETTKPVRYIKRFGYVEL